MSSAPMGSASRTAASASPSKRWNSAEWRNFVGSRDVVAHPRAAGLGPVAPCGERLQGVGQGVALLVGLPARRRRRAVAGGADRPAVDHAGAMADEAGGGADGAALADDHRLALGLDVPDVGQRQRQHLAGIELVVGLLRLAGDAVEQVVDGQAVRARLGAGAEVGVADGGQRRHRRHVRLAEPGAAGAQPRQRRQHVAVGVEVVGARAVEDEAARRRAAASRRAPAPRGSGRPTAVAGGAVPSSAASVGTTSCCATRSFQTTALMNGGPYSSSGTCVS